MTAAQAACLESALAEGHRLLMAGHAGTGAWSKKPFACWKVRDCLMRAEARITNLTACVAWTRRSWKGSGYAQGPWPPSRALSIPLPLHASSWRKPDMCCLSAGRPSRFAQYFGWSGRRVPGESRHRESLQLTPRDGLNRTLRLHQALLRQRSIRARSLGKETVGAVALDLAGTVAAGASTGGVDVMLPGRVGDTPLIGCGVYADNESGAVSMTGLGESIIRVAVAKEISDLLASGVSPVVSANRVLRKVVKAYSRGRRCIGAVPRWPVCDPAQHPAHGSGLHRQ